mgnify:CR=1 FL=1
MHTHNTVCTHLLARHELQGAVGAKVQHGICLEDLLQEGIEGSKAVVGGGALGEQQAHGVTLVAEGGLRVGVFCRGEFMRN